MPPLRLLVLTTSYPLTPQSYSGIFVRRMIEHLPRDMRITVVTPAARTDSAPSDRNNIIIRPFRYAPKHLQVLAHEPGGIPVALRSSPWTNALLPTFLLSMLVSCFWLGRRADVIHANWSICGCIAGAVGKFLRIPVVTTLRGEDITRARHHFLDRWVLSLCMGFSARIVTVSPTIETWLRDGYPGMAHKIQTIENGIEDKLLALPMVQPGPSTGRIVRLLTAGSLIPRKGINYIIDAIGSLANRQRVFLTVVGSGPEQPVLEKLAKDRGLNDIIEFIGAVEPQAIADLLAHTDVFILASHSEGRPNVILEAMAAGLPVIASDIEGINDLVNHGHTGFLFKPGAIDQLTEHIRTLLDDPTLRVRFGCAGRDSILTRQLSWNTTAERYNRLYESVFRGGSACAE